MDYLLLLCAWLQCHFFTCACPMYCYMLALLASHMMNTCSFYSVERNTIFTTHYAHYAWIVLHLSHVFGHFLLLGVVNDSYAYHRPFVERFMHDCYELEVDACSLVTHICITTSHLHACPHDIFACAQFYVLTCHVTILCQTICFA